MSILTKIFYHRLLPVVLLVGFFSSTVIKAQELNPDVKVASQKITGVNPDIFVSMQRSIQELLSTTSWTEKTVSPKELIPCSFIITIDKVEKENTYKANLQIQASRPVFNSSYTSTLINHKDKDLDFSYLPNESLQYSKGSKNDNNLVAVLAYYAHLIIGLEADSFSKYGGADYLKEAQNIVGRQNDSGWDSSERTNNRYWIIEDYRNLKGLRETMYNYHRKGLDFMVDKPRSAINTIAESLISLEKLYTKSSTQAALHLFFDAKYREISDSMKALKPEKKKKLRLVLEKIDPGHISTYKALEK